MIDTEHACVRYFTIGVQYGFRPGQIPHPMLNASTWQYIRVVGTDEEDCRTTFMQALSPFSRKWSHCYTDANSTHMKGGVVDLVDVLRGPRRQQDWMAIITNHLASVTTPSLRFAWYEMVELDWRNNDEPPFEPSCLRALTAMRLNEIHDLEAELGTRNPQPGGVSTELGAEGVHRKEGGASENVSDSTDREQRP